jgi:hypothetical protein
MLRGGCTMILSSPCRGLIWNREDVLVQGVRSRCRSAPGYCSRHSCRNEPLHVCVEAVGPRSMATAAPLAGGYLLQRPERQPVHPNMIGRNVRLFVAGYFQVVG